MTAHVFYDKTYSGTGAQAWLPLNRYGRDDYSIVVDVGTTGTYTIEGTLNKINRGETALSFEIAGLSGLTADVTDVIKATPLEAIRINIAANGSTVRLQVMQQGE